MNFLKLKITFYLLCSSFYNNSGRFFVGNHAEIILNSNQKQAFQWNNAKSKHFNEITLKARYLMMFCNLKMFVTSYLLFSSVSILFLLYRCRMRVDNHIEIMLNSCSKQAFQWNHTENNLKRQKIIYFFTYLFSNKISKVEDACIYGCTIFKYCDPWEHPVQAWQTNDT